MALNLNPAVGTSLSTIVSVAFPEVPSLAPPVGLLMIRYPVSFPSAAVSFVTLTVKD